MVKCEAIWQKGDIRQNCSFIKSIKKACLQRLESYMISFYFEQKMDDARPLNIKKKAVKNNELFQLYR